MGSVYGRLGFNFNTSLFDGDDTLSQGVLNFLGNTSIDLQQWQIDDLANNAVNGYYQNPHNDNLGVTAVMLTGLATYANTEAYGYDNTDLANTLLSTATSTQNALVNFTNHTNNLSGVTTSSNTAVFPDLNSALSVGRLVLNITNETDAVQNNTPILGNFTSLYIGDELTVYTGILANDFIVLSNSFDGANSNISNAQLSSITSNVSTYSNLISNRYNSDILFYTNSLGIVQDYQTVLQFSNLGATQNSLIQLIGTDKLKEDLS